MAPQVLSASEPIVARMNQVADLSAEVVASTGVPDILLGRLPAHGLLEPEHPDCTRLSQLTTRLPGMCGHFQYWPDVNYHGADSLSVQADDGYQLSDAASIGITVQPDYAVHVTSTVKFQDLLRSTLGSKIGRHELTIEVWVHTAGALRHYASVVSAQGKQVKVYVNGAEADSTDDVLAAALADTALGRSAQDAETDAYMDEILGWTVERTPDDISEDMSTSWDSLTPATAELPVIQQFFSSGFPVNESDIIVQRPVAGVDGPALNMAASSLRLACGEALNGSFTVGLHVQFQHEPKSNSVLLQRPGVFKFGLDTNGLLAFAIGANSLTGTNVAKTSAILHDGGWHYVMGSYHSNGGVRLYVDGHIMDLVWTSAVQAPIDCPDIVLDSFNGSVSAVAVHNTSLHGTFAVRSPHEVLYNYKGLHTAELWLLNEGSGSALQRTTEFGAKTGNGTVDGTATWFVPHISDTETIYLEPGEKVCIPLQVADMGTESRILMTAVPNAGFVFETDATCSTWLSRVMPGQAIAGRHLVYAAPLYPEEAVVGNLTYVAFNGKGHSRPMTLTFRTDASTPQCRCA
jgi:hypothetical protein